jgi:hypothetical protein
LLDVMHILIADSDCRFHAYAYGNCFLHLWCYHPGIDCFAMVLDRCVRHHHCIYLCRHFLSCQCSGDEGKCFFKITISPSLTILISHRDLVWNLSSSCSVLIMCADAVLRSALYSHFSESLSGLTTIRAYGESERFLHQNQERTDVENR